MVPGLIMIMIDNGNAKRHNPTGPLLPEETQLTRDIQSWEVKCSAEE